MHISIWEQESFFARQDVIVIGSGLAGLWCAYELLQKQPSLRLLIVEKGVIPSGASTRNAGFAYFGSPTELLHDAKLLGEDRMWQLTEMRYLGIQKIRKQLGDAAIAFDRCGGYECLSNNLTNIDQVREQLAWLNEGLKTITNEKQTFVMATEKLNQLGFQGFDGLVENKLEGGLHSGKLVMALQEKIRSLGGQILTGIAVESWEEDEKEVAVFASGNICIKTSRLLVCTNALSKHLLPNIDLMPARGQIIVTTPIDNLKVNGTFHFDEGFYYFRHVGNRLLLGGARNKAIHEEATTSFDTTPLIQQTLEQFLSTCILPNQSFSIDYRWSGVMGFTDNKEPLIKRLSDKVTAIVVCNGMGVALSPMIAEEVAS